MCVTSPISDDIIEASLIVLERELEEENLKEAQDNNVKAKNIEKPDIDTGKENLAKEVEEPSCKTTFLSRIKAKSFEQYSPKDYNVQPLKPIHIPLKNGMSFAEKELHKQDSIPATEISRRS
ncbi:hypothetical protein H1Q59_08290 [Holosporaceae bacterium 'Namur']|nr:hypothetical protein [Holosporaceae bacterium 'Namur']